jgi:hypothetical protein
VVVAAAVSQLLCKTMVPMVVLVVVVHQAE